MGASRSSNMRVTIKTYRWAGGCRSKKQQAQSFGQALEEIKRNRKAWNAANVVDYAKPKASPIHDMFEWRNAVAAHEYRLTQARYYMRHLEVTIESNGKDIQMPMAVSFGPGAAYKSTQDVMENKDWRAALISKALKEALAWKERWKHLSELADIFSEIDRLKKQAS